MATKLFDRVPTRRLGEIAYQRLIEAIASGRLPEGTKLYEDEIAKQMGVSKTPIREALRQLQNAGFVEADLHRTPVVRRLTQTDIDEIYNLREYLESLAVRLVADRPAGSQINDLELLQRGMEERFSSHAGLDVEASVEYNQAFHRTLIAASGSKRLIAIMEPLWMQILCLSFLSHRMYRLPGKQARAITEHREILDAIRMGDVTRGEESMRQHVKKGHRDLISSLAEKVEGRTGDTEEETMASDQTTWS